jgi:hypothetical protein
VARIGHRKDVCRGATKEMFLTGIVRCQDLDADGILEWTVNIGLDCKI